MLSKCFGLTEPCLTLNVAINFVGSKKASDGAVMISDRLGRAEQS